MRGGGSKGLEGAYLGGTGMWFRGGVGCIRDIVRSLKGSGDL